MQFKHLHDKTFSMLTIHTIGYIIYYITLLFMLYIFFAVSLKPFINENDF